MIEWSCRGSSKLPGPLSNAKGADTQESVYLIYDIISNVRHQTDVFNPECTHTHTKQLLVCFPSALTWCGQCQPANVFPASCCPRGRCIALRASRTIFLVYQWTKPQLHIDWKGNRGKKGAEYERRLLFYQPEEHILNEKLTANRVGVVRGGNPLRNRTSGSSHIELYLRCCRTIGPEGRIIPVTGRM